MKGAEGADTDDDFVVLSVAHTARVEDLQHRMLAAPERLIVLHFDGQTEHPFTSEDSDFLHALAALPLAGKLSMGYVDTEISGRDLAFFLRCFLPVVGPRATLATTFGQPASAAIYASAANRIGMRACEKLLYGAEPLTADVVTEAGLTTFAETIEGAIASARSRFSTPAFDCEIEPDHMAVPARSGSRARRRLSRRCFSRAAVQSRFLRFDDPLDMGQRALGRGKDGVDPHADDGHGFLV